MKKWLFVTLGSILFMFAYIWIDQLHLSFSIPTNVILAVVIIFFIEKNGIQTRMKIEQEFDELHERLQYKDDLEKKAKEEKEEEKFSFVNREEAPADSGCTE